MTITKLSPILLMLLLAACVKPPIISPESQAEADKAIDYEQARKLGNSIADNLVKNEVWVKSRRPVNLDVGFRTSFTGGLWEELNGLNGECVTAIPRLGCLR